MYSLQVLFPKIDWIDRMIIAFKQHKTPVVQPVAGWSSLTCSFFSVLGRLSFVVDVAHLPAWKTSQLSRYAESTRFNRKDLYQEVRDSGRVALRSGSRMDFLFFFRTILQINTGLVGLASRGVDGACSESVGWNSAKMLKDKTVASHKYLSRLA